MMLLHIKSNISKKVLNVLTFNEIWSILSLLIFKLARKTKNGNEHFIYVSIKVKHMSQTSSKIALQIEHLSIAANSLCQCKIKCICPIKCYFTSYKIQK